MEALLVHTEAVTKEHIQHKVGIEEDLEEEEKQDRLLVVIILTEVDL